MIEVAVRYPLWLSPARRSSCTSARCGALIEPIVRPLRAKISVGTKPQCSRSVPSNGNIATFFWSGVRAATSLPAASAMAPGERSAAPTAPSHAATQAATSNTRGERLSFMADLSGPPKGGHYVLMVQ